MGADANRLNKDFGSPLHYACWQGDGNDGREDSVIEETVQALIDGGANPNQISRGLHPLHEAAGGDWGSPTSARVLLRNGAEVDPRNEEGQTPLMIAAELGEPEVVRVLLEFGADRTLRDNYRKTAVDYAAANVKRYQGRSHKAANKMISKMFGHFQIDVEGITSDSRMEAEEVMRLLSS